VRKIEVVGRNLNGIPATAHSGQQGEAVETWLGEDVIWVTSIWEVTVKNIVIRNLKVHCLKRIIMTLKVKMVLKCILLPDKQVKYN